LPDKNYSGHRKTLKETATYKNTQKRGPEKEMIHITKTMVSEQFLYGISAQTRTPHDLKWHGTWLNS